MTTLQEVPPIPETDAPKPDPRPRHFGRGRILRWLKNIQRGSAYGILAFAGLHLTSTVVLPPLSIPAADSAFMVARDIYQSELGERLLVYGAFSVHVVSGLILRAVRIYSQYSDFGKLSFGPATPITYSGFALTALTLLHYIAVRLGPTRALGDSSLISLQYITFDLHKHLSKTSLGLFLLVGTFSFHALHGINQYLRLRLRPVTRITTLAGITLLTVTSLTSLAAQPVPTGWLADQYHAAGSMAERLMGMAYLKL